MRNLKKGSLIKNSLLAILYEYDNVNHPVNFIDVLAGAHANTFEGTWNAFRLVIKLIPATKEEIILKIVSTIFWWNFCGKDSLQVIDRAVFLI
ncbi:hypothetical protein HZS_5404 [Henneguya salminicola]|nr:hypothetical protein HZS_5404 [Henneguya salminicola]